MRERDSDHSSIANQRYLHVQITMAESSSQKLDDFTIHKDGVVWNASLVMLNHFRYVC